MRLGSATTPEAQNFDRSDLGSGWGAYLWLYYQNAQKAFLSNGLTWSKTVSSQPYKPTKIQIPGVK